MSKSFIDNVFVSQLQLLDLSKLSMLLLKELVLFRSVCESFNQR